MCIVRMALNVDNLYQRNLLDFGGDVVKFAYQIMTIFQD